MLIKKLLPISTCILVGCNSAAYLVAYGVYKEQPLVRKVQNTGHNIPVKQAAKEPIVDNNSEYFIAVASSGGGYRATYTTLGALMAFAQIPSIKGNNNFLADIDLFSSVSGSGLAVGYYIANYDNDKNFDLNKNIYNLIKADKLTGKKNILRQDLDSMLFAKNYDAKLIEHFNRITSNASGPLKLVASYEKAQRHELPRWLINATIYQNMAGLVISPHNLKQLGIAKNTIENMDISTALLASAAFPMAIPPLKLKSSSCKTSCYIYLMDGGIYDNLGMTAAIDVIKQMHGKKNILIVIDANEKPQTPFSASSHKPTPAELLMKMPEMITDSQSNKMYNSIIPENTLLIILKLSKFKQGLGVTTRFNSSLSEQKKLIAIGRKMVLSNLQIKKLYKS